MSRDFGFEPSLNSASAINSIVRVKYAPDHKEEDDVVSGVWSLRSALISGQRKASDPSSPFFSYLLNDTYFASILIPSIPPRPDLALSSGFT